MQYQKVRTTSRPPWYKRTGLSAYAKYERTCLAKYSGFNSGANSARNIFNSSLIFFNNFVSTSEVNSVILSIQRPARPLEGWFRLFVRTIIDAGWHVTFLAPDRAF